jgi:PKD repeat protein
VRNLLKEIVKVTAVVLLLTHLPAAGELARPADLDRVAENWLTLVKSLNGDWGGSESPRIVEAHDLLSDDLLLARCYIIEQSGYIVVPALMQLPPVFAFSTQGTPDLDQKSGVIGLLRDVLNDRYQTFAQIFGSLDVTPVDSEGEDRFRNEKLMWQQLSAEPELVQAWLTSSQRPTREQVGPLISTTWHQLAPYNNYCPWGDGNRSVVWCVATALAQIIRYHEWPPAGFGHTSYMWNGDQSCGGSSPGLLLQANFSDRYFYNDTNHDVAELSMEVGKSYHVDYGVCYSVGDTTPTYSLLPHYFAYQDSVTDNYRADFTADEWFAIVQEEINNDRPIDYLIFNHMIACDGWMTIGEQKYYHMNYGWGGGSTVWYTLDNLYCNWAGCDPMVEHMYTHIEPDRQIMFYADTLAGNAPLTLQFAGTSSEDVSSWLWTFGDGDSASEQNPKHTYYDPGIYDVTLRIEFDDTARTRTRSQYIYVLADSVKAVASEAVPGTSVMVAVNAENLMPLSRILLPLTYAGDLDLSYDSCSVADCRTAHFQSIGEVSQEPENKRLLLDLEAWVSGYSEKPFLDAGEGSILKLFFTVPAGALPSQQATISFGGYGSYQPTFYGSIYGFEHRYQPAVLDLVVKTEALCGDADGNAIVNISDAVFLISYIFGGGQAPNPQEAGDADCNEIVNISDAVYLISYIFGGGPAPCEGCP